MRMGSRHAFVALLSSALVMATPAAASGADEPWRTELELPAGCADTFTPELSRRGPVIVSRDAERVLRVSVRRDGDRWRGRLEVHDAEARTDRAIDGASCEQVIEGLALVAALAVDSRRAVERHHEAEEIAPGPPAIAAPPPAEVPPLARPASARSFALVVSPAIEASGLVEAPTTSLGGAATVESTTNEPWSGWGRARFLASFTSTTESRSATTDLSWIVASLEGSPLRLRLVDTLGLRPVVGLDAGIVRAHPTSITATETSTRTRPWIAGRGGLLLVYAPAPFLRIDVGGGLLVPMMRESFVFAPAEQVYRPPSVAWFAGGSIGLPIL